MVECSLSVESTHATLECLNNCTGSLETSLNQEKQCIHDFFSKGEPGAKTYSRKHQTSSGAMPPIKGVPIYLYLITCKYVISSRWDVLAK